MCAFSQTLYDGKWHQLKLLVRPRQVTSFLDDQLIGEVLLEPVEPIYISGETQVAKRRGTDITVPVSNNAATWRSKHTLENKEIMYFDTRNTTNNDCRGLI